MRSFPQLLVGMAAAGVAAGPQRPFALVVGAVAGVLPDVIDGWRYSLFRQPDITVTPDPLEPSPAIMAQGVRAAMQQVRESERSCVVRFHPLPAPETGFSAYQLDCDRHHRLIVTLESNGKSAPVDPPGTKENAAALFLPHHPMPLRITDKPLDLQLHAHGQRIESRDLSLTTQAGHSLPIAAAIVIAASAIHLWAGLAAAAALSAHLLLEIGGCREMAFFWPFAAQTRHGYRLWNDRSWRANLCASILAITLLAALLRAAK